MNLPRPCLQRLIKLCARGGEADLLPLSAHYTEGSVSANFFG